MRVDIEFVRLIQGARALINNQDLADIEFFEDGQRVEVSAGTVADWTVSGFNNMDFITSKEYKRQEV